MTATKRAEPQARAGQDTGDSVVRVGYRRFAGIRTRVLEVGPRPSGERATTRRRPGKRAGAKPSAPRLVLLHGYCDSADTWRPVLSLLAEAGVAAMAVDLPGFGEADELRPGAILPQLDTFTAAVIKEQSVLGQVVLVGNSLGGTMSLRAAQNERLPVAGVVSIAAPGFVDSWLIRTVARYPLPLRMYSSLPLPVPGFLVRAVTEQVVPRLLYADQGQADPAHVRRFTSQFTDYRSTTSRLKQARQLVEELAQAYQLDRVEAPLLIVACGRDRLVSAASGRQLHSLVPHSRLLVRDDWGHCPQLDDPLEISELLTYFAAGVTRPAKRGHPAVQAAPGDPDSAAG